jgi:subtilisin-like proprotein convertase family protein
MFRHRAARLLFAVLAVLAVLAAAPAAADLVTATWTSAPALAIPDADQYVTDAIDVPLGSLVVGVEVYLAITHPLTEDLTVRLISPAGTDLKVLWHRSGGEPVSDPVGWYPLDFAPEDDLAGFAGEITQGDWTLRIQDHAAPDAGTLDEWRLRLVYDDLVPVLAASWGRIKALYR